MPSRDAASADGRESEHMPLIDHRFSPGRRALALGGLALARLASSARAQSPVLTGDWSSSWRGSRGTYEGTLEVGVATNPSVYAVRPLLRVSRGGTVNEDATITVTGRQVRIECANSTFKGFESWSPDRFCLN